MICPYCSCKLVAFKWQCEDNSGWVYGWLCKCNESTRNSVVNIVVFSDTVFEKCKQQHEQEDNTNE